MLLRAQQHTHGVREAERVLSAPDSFAALELPLQLTDRAVVRRAFRRIALEIHTDKAWALAPLPRPPLHCCRRRSSPDGSTRSCQPRCRP